MSETKAKNVQIDDAVVHVTSLICDNASKKTWWVMKEETVIVFNSGK